MKKLLVLATVVSVCATVSLGAKYTTADYIQDGLVAQFDGIDNQGTGVHVPGATTWKCLKTGQEMPLSAGSEFREGKYLYATNAMSVTGTFLGTPPPEFATLQGVAKPLGTYRSYSAGYTLASCGGISIGFDTRISGGLSLNAVTNLVTGDKNVFYYCQHPENENSVAGLLALDRPYTYTVINTPTSPLYYVNGSASTHNSGSFYSAAYTYSDKISIGLTNDGGRSHANYAVRVYNRPLTPEEIAWNSRVDRARFEGIGETLTWTGAASAKFSNSGNWKTAGGQAAVPSDGDLLVINNTSGAVLTLENDIDGLSVAGLAVTGGKGVVLDGNQIELTGGASAWKSEGAVTVNCALKLAEGDQSFNVKNTTTVNGVISGKGKLVKTGLKGNVDTSGILELAGANTYEGGTEIKFGSLDALNVYAFGDTNKEVYINNAAASPTSDHTALRIRVTSFYYPIHILDTFTGSTTWCENNWCGHNVDAMVDNVSIYNRIYGGSFHLRGWEKDAKDSGSSRTVTVYGDIDCPGAQVTFFGGTCHYRSRIRTGTLGASPYTQTKVYFYNSGNEFTGSKGGTSSLYYACGANAFHGIGFSYSYLSSDDKTYLQGYDQEIDRMTGKMNADRGGDVAGSTWHTIDGGNQDRKTMLTMRATGNCDSLHRFAGSLSICWNPTNSAYVFNTYSNRVNAMTGVIIVSNGTFNVNGTTSFKQVTGLQVARNATLGLYTSANQPFESVDEIEVGAGGRIYFGEEATRLFKKDPAVNLETGATLDVPAGMTLQLASVSIDGFAVDPDDYTKAGGAEWISGGGTVKVVQSLITPVKWTGGGEDDTSVGTAANWDVAGTVAKLGSGNLLATFATGGRTATVDRVVSLDGVKFEVGATETGFRVRGTGELGIGMDGIVASARETAAEYVIESPLRVLDYQNWAPGTKAQLTVKGPLHGVSGMEITRQGGGMVKLIGHADSTFAGDFRIIKGITEATGCDPFGPGTEGGGAVTFESSDSADSGTTRLTIRDAVITKPFYNKGTIRCLHLKGDVVFENAVTNTAELRMDDETVATFRGGGYFNMMPLSEYKSTTVVFTNKPVYVQMETSETRQMTIRFDVAGNEVPVIDGYYAQHVRFGADYAFDQEKAHTRLHVKANASYSDGSVDFEGHDQRFDVLYGEVPRILRKNSTTQYYYAWITNSSAKAATAYMDGLTAVTNYCPFSGPINISKGGSRLYSMGSDTTAVTNTSPGSLEVTGGTMRIGPKSVWSGDAIVGDGALLTVTDDTALTRNATVRISGSGKIRLDNDQPLVVHYLYIDGQLVWGEDYSAAHEKYGSHFEGSGILRVRSPRGSLLMVK